MSTNVQPIPEPGTKVPEVSLYHPEVLSSEAYDTAYQIFSDSYDQIATDILAHVDVDELNQPQFSPLQKWLCYLFDSKNEGNKLKFILSLFPPASLNHQIFRPFLINKDMANQDLKRSVFTTDPKKVGSCTLEFSRLSNSFNSLPKEDLYASPKKMQFLTPVNIDDIGRYKIDDLKKEKKSLKINRNNDSITYPSHFNQNFNQKIKTNTQPSQSLDSLELSADLFKQQFIASDSSLFKVHNPNFASAHPWAITPKILSKNDAMFDKLQVIFTDHYFKIVHSLEKKAVFAHNEMYTKFKDGSHGQGDDFLEDNAVVTHNEKYIKLKDQLSGRKCKVLEKQIVIAHNEKCTKLKDELHGLKYSIIRNHVDSLFVKVFYSLLKDWKLKDFESEKKINPFLIDVNSILDFENLMLFYVISTKKFHCLNSNDSTHAAILLTRDLKKVFVTKNCENSTLPNRLNLINSINGRYQIKSDLPDYTSTEFDQFGTPLDRSENTNWCQKFPGGKIDENIDGTGFDATLREFKEEIGISLENFDLPPPSQFRTKRLYTDFTKSEDEKLKSGERPSIEVRNGEKIHFYYPIVLSKEQEKFITDNVNLKTNYRLCSNLNYCKAPDWAEVLDVDWPLLSSLVEDKSKIDAFFIAAKDCFDQIQGIKTQIQGTAQKKK